MIKIKYYSAALLTYLGDAAHRRFVSVAIAMVATKFIGKAFDANDVANALELVIGGFGGAWSSTTPKIDPVAVADNG